jgi:hypothetical protein
MAVPPPPPPPSLLANALASLSLPALSLAFGLPLLAFSRLNTATCDDGGGQGGEKATSTTAASGGYR